MKNSNKTKIEKMQKLAIPIYLDTNVLLDLLASLEDGFSMIEKITTRQTASSGSEKSVGTEFGIANVLNILKLGIRAYSKVDKSKNIGEERSSERYHTYGSLLSRLREKLQSLIKTIDDWEDIKTTDFVELKGCFKPNPLIESFKVLNSLLKMVKALDLTNSVKLSKKQKKVKEETRELETIQKWLGDVIKDVEGSGIQTFIVRLSDNSNKHIVMSLFDAYLRDSSKTELLGGEFCVLGKVVKKLESDNGEEINLLKGSALSSFNDEIISQLVESLKGTQAYGIELPEITTSINGPAIQVLPIAIYV